MSIWEIHEITGIVIGYGLLITVFLYVVSRLISLEHTPRHKSAEMMVSSQLRSLDKRHYVVFDNIVLPAGDGKSYTEIDHIVVSPFGIWCIETKSHRGQIYGYKNASIWRQYLGKKSFSLQNPYHQNHRHTYILHRILGLDIDVEIHNTVIFTDASKVTIDKTPTSLDIDHAIRAIKAQHRPIFTQKQCETILQTLGRYDRIKEQNLSRHLASSSIQ